MNHVRKMILLALGFGILAAVLSFFPNHRVAASGSAPVTVVNTPNVNVANSPTVSLATGTSVGVSGSVSVNVANPATTPALVLNVNDPGRIPYQAVGSVDGCPANSCVVIFAAIPPSHRLVVQHVSGTVTFPGGGQSTVGVSLGTVSTTYSTFIAQNFAILAVFNQMVLAYFEPGQQPLLAAFELVGTSTPVTATVTITGYLLDCSIASCAAIAP